MEPIKEVTFERVYDAPIDKVWEAWTNPEMLKQWWGPDNVSIPECQIDVRVGGKFYIVMEAGEAMGQYKGLRWPMDAEFTVVEPNAKLAYNARAWTEGEDKEDTMIEQTTEITFSQESGPENSVGASKTKIIVKASIYQTGPKAKMAAEGMQYGFTQQLAKLEKFLA